MSKLSDEHKTSQQASSADQEALRERIRKIWRPLYDLGLNGAEQIDAQYMAYVVSAAVDETETLISAQIQLSNKALLERLRDGLPERKILPTVQEQFAHPIILMKEAEQAEFNRALDQVTALLDKEESDL